MIRLKESNKPAQEFRCELPVSSPGKFLENCKIPRQRVDANELERANWIWNTRPLKQMQVARRYCIYAVICGLLTIGSLAQSTSAILAVSAGGFLAIEIMERLGKKKLSRWSKDYQGCIQRLLNSSSEDDGDEQLG